MQNKFRVGQWLLFSRDWRCYCNEHNRNDYNTIWCGFCSTERPKTPPNKSMHLTAGMLPVFGIALARSFILSLWLALTSRK